MLLDQQLCTRFTGFLLLILIKYSTQTGNRTLKDSVGLLQLKQLYRKHIISINQLDDNTAQNSKSSISSYIKKSGVDRIVVWCNLQCQQKIVAEIHRVIRLRYRKSTLEHWIDFVTVSPYLYPDLHTIPLDQLRDHNIIVGVVHSPPALYIRGSASTGNLNVSGYFPDIAEALAKLLQFRIQYIPVDTFGGLTANKTWGGIVGKLINKTLDLGCLGITLPRQEVISFAPYIGRVEIFIVFNKPRFTPGLNYMFYLKSYSLRTWISIVGILLLSALLLVRNYENYPANNQEFHLQDMLLDTHVLRTHTLPQQILSSARKEFMLASRFLKNLFFLQAILFQQGDLFKSVRLTSRIIIASFSIFVLFIVMSYSSSLTAERSVQKDESDIRSLDDLMDHNYKIGLVKGNYMGSILQTSKGGSFKRAWNIVQMDSKNFVKSHRHGIEKVCHEKFAFIIGQVTLQGVENPSCCFTILPLFPLDINLVLSKHSSFADAVSVGLHVMKSTGIIDYIYKKHVKKPKLSICFTKVKTSCGLNEFVGAFLILLAGYFVCIICFCIELLNN